MRQRVPNTTLLAFTVIQSARRGLIDILSPVFHAPKDNAHGKCTKRWSFGPRPPSLVLPFRFPRSLGFEAARVRSGYVPRSLLHRVLKCSLHLVQPEISAQLSPTRLVSLPRLPMCPQPPSVVASGLCRAWPRLGLHWQRVRGLRQHHSRVRHERFPDPIGQSGWQQQPV